MHKQIELIQDKFHNALKVLKRSKYNDNLQEIQIMKKSQTIFITLTVLLSVVPAFALPAAGTRTLATAAFSVPASEVGDAASYYV